MQDAPVHASPGGGPAPASASRAQGSSSESPNVSPHQAYPPQFGHPQNLNHATHPHMLPYSQATYAYHPLSMHQPSPPVGVGAPSSHVPSSASSSSYNNTAGSSHAHAQQQQQSQQQQQHSSSPITLTHQPIAMAEAGPSNSIISHLATAPSFGSTSTTRRSSGGGKTFTCTGYQGCSMSFSRSEHLARHVRKHTGEKPFTCRCGKKFTRLDNLRQHASTIHSDEPEANEELFTRLAAHMPRSGRAAAPRQKQQPAASTSSNNNNNTTPSVNDEPSFSSPSSPSTPAPVTASGNQAPIHTATLEQQTQREDTAQQHPAAQSTSQSFARQLEPIDALHAAATSLPMQDYNPISHSLPRPLPSPSFRFPASAAASTAAAPAPAIYHHPLASARHHYSAGGPGEPIHHYPYPPQESDFASHQGPSPTLPPTQHFILPSHHHAPEQHQHQHHQPQYYNAQQPHPYPYTHPSQAHHGGRGGSSFRVTQHHPHPQPHPYPHQGQQQHSYTTTSGIEYSRGDASSSSSGIAFSQHQDSESSSSSVKQQYPPVNAGVNGGAASASSSSSGAAGQRSNTAFTSKPTLPSLSSLIAGEPLPSNVQTVDARYLHDGARTEDEHQQQRVHSSLLAAADLAMHRHSAPPPLPLRMSVSMNRSPLLHINPPAYDSRSSSFSATSSSSTSAGHHTAATTPPPSITSPCSSIQTA